MSAPFDSGMLQLHCADRQADVPSHLGGNHAKSHVS
jgi:hypothetical protein